MELEFLMSIDKTIRAAWIQFAAVLLGAGAALCGSRNILRSTNDKIKAERRLAAEKIGAERAKEKDRIGQEEPVAASMLSGHLAVFMVICHQMMQKAIFDSAIENSKFPEFEKYDDKLPWRSLDRDIVADAHVIRNRLICISLNMRIIRTYNQSKYAVYHLEERGFRRDFKETGSRCVNLIREAMDRHLPDKTPHRMDEEDIRFYDQEFSARLPEEAGQ